MAKKIKSGKCVHCLQHSDDITYDHAFPVFWYPSDTPERVQRARVPSCYSCNNRLGAIEQEVGILMWACIDPSKPQARGLRQKVMEHFGIGANNLTPKEKVIREKLKKKFLERMYPYNSSMKPFPGFGPHKNFSIKKQRAIDIPTDKLYIVAEKVIRALEYRQGGRYIETPYKLEIFPAIRESELPTLVSMIEKLPVNQHGPGFEIRRAATTDGEEILYRIEFWGTWILYGFISKEPV